MSNLNDAFLKAYAKRPAEQAQASTGGVRKSANNESPNFFASPAQAHQNPSTAHRPAVAQQRATPESGTAVVSSLRTASKSSTVRKVDAPHVPTSRFEGPNDRHFRVDNASPERADSSVLAAAQKPPARQVKRQPLSEYLAEMRQQVSDLQNQAGNDQAPQRMPAQKEQHIVQQVPSTNISSSAIYTYPEKKPTANVAPTKQTATASPSFVDKRTLRQLANSSGAVNPQASVNAQTRMTKDHSSVPQATKQPSTPAVKNSPVARPAAPQSKMEPLTVRETWREAEKIHRVDHNGRPIVGPHVDAGKVVRPPAAPTSQANEAASRRVDEARPSFREDQSAPHWNKTTSGASVEMAQSLSGYNPNSESGVLYRQAKMPSTNGKSAAGQKLAKSNHAIVAPLNPEWEVDTFQWPFTVLDLLEAQEPAFEEIANHLMAANRKGLKTVAITSAERGVGKSTTCMCLGALMAHKGLKVAIIDGDVENPALYNQLNLEFPHGWQDCIRDNVPLESVAVKSLGENVTLFPLTDSMSGEEVGSNRIKVNHLMRRIAKSYDMVFVDTHRISYRSSQLIGTGDDAALDAALVVVDTELSVKERIDTTLQMLHDQKINSIGVVENFSNLDLSSDRDS